jgi:hypothetical protein
VLIGAAAFLSTAPLSASLALAAGTWRITATGYGVAVSAVVPMGRLPTATALEKSIRLEWAPSMYPAGIEVSSYAIMRQVVGSKDAVKVCTVPSPLRACEDSPPVGQPVTYTVVPTEQLWRGPASAPSSPVTLPAPAVVAAAAVPSPSATPSPSLTPSATSTPSPIGSPLPTPRPVLRPTPSPTPPPAPS